jgi:hypothetical protein
MPDWGRSDSAGGDQPQDRQHGVKSLGGIKPKCTEERGAQARRTGDGRRLKIPFAIAPTRSPKVFLRQI